MNTENFDMEQMRKAWLAMGESLGMRPGPDGNNEDLSKKKTSLDRLRNRYQAFGFATLLLAFGTFMIFSGGQIIESHLNLWLGASYALYFLTCFAIDRWLYHGVSAIDPVRMSVTQVANKSLLCRKHHLQSMAVLIPMVIALLGFTGYVFSAEKYMLVGMAIGAVCGALLGIIQFRRFMAEYRNLSE